MSKEAFDRQRAAIAIDGTAAEKHVLLVLATRGDAKGICTPGIARIVMDTGLSERTVQRSLASLKAKGHLSWVEKSGIGRTYTVHPSQVGTPATVAPPPQCQNTPATVAPKQPRTTISQKTSSSSRGRAKTKKLFHRLPAEWRPTRPLSATLAAKVALWPSGKVAAELENFTAWAANAKDEDGKGRKLDWDQAWGNWLRGKDDDWQHKRPANCNGAQLGRTNAAAVSVFGEPECEDAEPDFATLRRVGPSRSTGPIAVGHR
ncbi:MAG: hypothetical protein EON59_06845 [Alphaproteobacteria bacterium]|nr:MAG: hypothetical protein EON59_06845 [Alphaproteobacteria bacterium]